MGGGADGMRQHSMVKLAKLLTKLEKQFEEIPEKQVVKRERIMKKYENLVKRAERKGWM